MRSGNIDVTNGYLWVAGANGYDWSKTSSSRLYDGSTVSSAYDLGFTTKVVASADGPYGRWGSIPFRCRKSLLTKRYYEITEIRLI